MAPNFSGNLEDDHNEIVKLNIISVMVGIQLLRGDIVMKTLAGPSEKEYFKLYSKIFT